MKLIKYLRKLSIQNLVELWYIAAAFSVLGCIVFLFTRDARTLYTCFACGACVLVYRLSQMLFR